MWEQKVKGKSSPTVTEFNSPELNNNHYFSIILSINTNNFYTHPSFQEWHSNIAYIAKAKEFNSVFASLFIITIIILAINISQLSSVLKSFILDKGVLKYPSTSNFFGLNSLYFANCSLASSFLSSKL